MNARSRLGIGALVLLLLAVVLLLWAGGDDHGPGTAAGPDTATSPAPGGARGVRPRAPRPDPPPSTGDPEPVVEPEPVDPDGAFVVRVLRAGTEDPLPDAVVEAWDENGARLAEARTDKKGRALFTAGLAEYGFVRARAPSCVSEFEMTGFEEGELRLELTSGGRTITGVVLDDVDGSPLPGATVTLLDGGELEGEASFSMGPPIGTTRTDERGAFSLSGARSDELATVRASAKGYARGESVLRLADDDASTDRVELRLRPGGTIHGIVRDPDGDAVADADVYAVPDGMHDVLEYPEDDEDALHVVTGADGSFRFEGVPQDAVFDVVAQAEEFARSTVWQDVRIDPGSAGARGELRLRRPATLEVVVTGPDGTPVRDARLSLDPGTQDRETSAEGHPLFARVTPGKQILSVSAPGLREFATSVDLREGEARRIDVTLERGAHLAGTVVDDTGRTLAGAEVRVSGFFEDLPHGPELSEQQVRTDAAGRFRVEGLFEGAYRVVALHAHHVSAALDDVAAPADGLRLTLVRTGSATIRLTVDEGATAPRTVYVVRHGYRRSDLSGNWSWSDGHSRVRWNEGEFRFDDLPPGPARIGIYAEGFAPLELAFDVRAALVAQLAPRTLGAGRSITLRVETSDGKPAVGARVRTGLYGTPTARDLRTDGTGTVTLDQQAASDVVVDVDAEGHLSQRVTLAADDAAPRVRLRRGAVLHGTLDVAAPDTLRVVVTDAVRGKGGFRDSTPVDQRGRFSIRVPAGTHSVELRNDEDAVLQTLEVVVTEGEDRALELAPSGG